MVNDEHIQAKKQERTRMGEQLTLRVRFTTPRQREPLAHLAPEHIRDTGGDKQQVHPKHSGQAIHIVLTTQAYHTRAKHTGNTLLAAGTSRPA